MTWEQLRGLNYGTMGRSIRGNLWIDGERAGRAWHFPPDTWRLENAAGEPTVVETAAEEFRRAADGVMVHAIKAGTTRVVATVGTPPWRLLTGYSQWPPPSSLPEAAALEPVGAPRQVEVRGRRGWEMLFTAAGTGQEVRCVIDAETGVVLRRSTGAEVAEVSDPVLDERFDPALFTWTGPVRAERDQMDALRRASAEKARRLAELPRPGVTWLPAAITVNPTDGDPRTGALDLWVSLRGPTLILRQWLTEIGEPEPDFGVARMPVRHRGTRGPWTFELRGHDPLDPADGARIIDSLDLPTPPAMPPARLRELVEREAAAAAEAELREALGTGRRLDDHLGGGHGSLLVRTAFGDEESWRAVAVAAMAPGGGPDGDFAADLTCVDHPENDGMTVDALLGRIGDGPPYFVFLADETTLTHPEHPILAVDTGPEETGHIRGRTLRVIPAAMSAIENNLSLSNLDFGDFVRAADPDGVYRR